MTLPACGLYRTTRALDHVPAGALVYFHNHGEPGPGLYLPSGWSMNRATWNERGHTLLDPGYAASLVPLPAEGLYRVVQSFHCCDKRCVRFEENQLVQLGYDGAATPILFVPEWSEQGLGFPERGTKLDGERLGLLQPLTVARGISAPRDGFIH